MMFCSNCGGQLPEGANVCPNCGTPVQNNVNAMPQQPMDGNMGQPMQPINNGMNQPMGNPQQMNNGMGQQAGDQQQMNNGMGQPMGNPNQFANGAMPQGGIDVTTDKAAAILAYIIAFIPYFFMKPNTEFGRFHAGQGFNLFLLNIIFNVIGSIVSNLIGGPITYLFSLADLFFLVMNVMGIVYAAKGEMTELPLVSQIKLIKY